MARHVTRMARINAFLHQDGDDHLTICPKDFFFTDTTELRLVFNDCDGGFSHRLTLTNGKYVEFVLGYCLVDNPKNLHLRREEDYIEPDMRITRVAVRSRLDSGKMTIWNCLSNCNSRVGYYNVNPASMYYDHDDAFGKLAMVLPMDPQIKMNLRILAGVFNTFTTSGMDISKPIGAAEAASILDGTKYPPELLLECGLEDLYNPIGYMIGKMGPPPEEGPTDPVLQDLDEDEIHPDEGLICSDSLDRNYTALALPDDRPFMLTEHDYMELKQFLSNLHASGRFNGNNVSVTEVAPEPGTKKKRFKLFFFVITNNGKTEAGRLEHLRRFVSAQICSHSQGERLTDQVRKDRFEIITSDDKLMDVITHHGYLRIDRGAGRIGKFISLNIRKDVEPPWGGY